MPFSLALVVVLVWLISAVAIAVFAAVAALVALAFAVYGNFGFEIFNLGIQIHFWILQSYYNGYEKLW